MNKLPKKFSDRVRLNIKRYQRIAETQQRADVAEADTVTLVKDMLADIFGFDKYEELTSEHQIKATYCDLAIKLGGKLMRWTLFINMLNYLTSLRLRPSCAPSQSSLQFAGS